MTQVNHKIVRKFIAAMHEGVITDELVTEDFHVWIVGSDEMANRESYVQGIALLPRVFPGKLQFEIKSITAEGDRAIAEFSGLGTTQGGEIYRNDYLYLFRIRADVADAIAFLGLWTCNGTLNRSGFCSPEYDDLAEETRQEDERSE